MDRSEALSILGLGTAATSDEIRARILKLLNELHPDKHPEVKANETLKKLLEEKFSRVVAARDYLLNDSPTANNYSAKTQNSEWNEAFEKPPPPDDEIPQACGKLGISARDFEAALAILKRSSERMSRVGVSAEAEELAFEKEYPGLINVIRGSAIGQIVRRVKLELLKTLEGRPDYQSQALLILESSDVVPFIPELPLAGLCVAYSMLGNPRGSSLSDDSATLTATWESVAGLNGELVAIGDAVMVSILPRMPAILGSLKRGADSLNIELRSEPWDTLLAMFMRRMAGLAFWTGLKLISKPKETAKPASAGSTGRSVFADQEVCATCGSHMFSPDGQCVACGGGRTWRRSGEKGSADESRPKGKMGGCPRCGASDFYGDGSCRSCGRKPTGDSGSIPISSRSAANANRKPDFFDAAASVARDSWNGFKSKLHEWAQESPTIGERPDRKPAPGPMNFSNQSDFFHTIDETVPQRTSNETQPTELNSDPPANGYSKSVAIPAESQPAGTCWYVSLGVRPNRAMDLAQSAAANTGFMYSNIDSETAQITNGIWGEYRPFLTFRKSDRGTDVFLTFSGKPTRGSGAMFERALTELKIFLDGFLHAARTASIETTCPPHRGAARAGPGRSTVVSGMDEWQNAVRDLRQAALDSLPKDEVSKGDDGEGNGCACGCLILIAAIILLWIIVVVATTGRL